MAADMWVGCETGILKGVNLEKSTFINYGELQSLDRTHEVCCMCWADEHEKQLYLGLKSGIVKTFSIEKEGFSSQYDVLVDKGPIRGICSYENKLVACSENGCLRIFEGDEKINEKSVGSDISKMRHDVHEATYIGTGGNENALKIWNMEQLDKPVFQAKNVRNDELDLRVPVWVTDLDFLPHSPGSLPCIVTGSAYRQVRLYDPRAQKRPVLSLEFEDSAITSVTVTPDGNSVIVGNGVGTVANIELRKGQRLGDYKGFAGSVRCIQCDSNRNQVAACGLDRFLRVYDITSRKLLHKVYLKSKLNHLMFAKKVESTPEVVDSEIVETSKRSQEESDEEGDDLWNQMEEVTEETQQNSSKKSKKKIKK